jgi:O-antigen ligase
LLPGVAKIKFLGKTLIRSYSLFPHPNVFGGFLIFSIISGFIIQKINQLELKFVPRGTNLYSSKTNNSNYKLAIAKIFASINITKSIHLSIRETLVLVWNLIKRQIIYIILLTLFISLILTFSKSAWLGVIIALVYVSLNHVPRRRRLILLKWLSRIAVLIVLLAIVYFQTNSSFLNIGQSYSERLIYLKPAINMITANPLFGVGMGQFVPRMEQFSNSILQAWQFQPVHNAFLLVWSEIGLIGFVILILFLDINFNQSYNKICSTWNKFIPNNIWEGYIKSILLAFMVIMLFDHYFWDIQQGQIMLWLVLGFLAGLNS